MKFEHSDGLKWVNERSSAANMPIGDSPILFDVRWFGAHGMGRFASELAKRLPGLKPYGSSRRPSHPLDPLLLGLDLRRGSTRLFFSPGYNPPIGSATPFVFTLHDLHHLCVPEDSSMLKRGYYRYVIRPACREAVFVLTVSEYSRREISAWAEINEERIVNVGNGAGEPFTCCGERYRCDRPYFLYVGSYRPHKNLHRLLQAYAKSGTSGDVKLLLTGPGCQALAVEIGRLGIENCVEFVGYTDDQTLAKLYRGAVALVFPSLYEGFGLPPLEAMACGTPVLTSNVCALPEVVGDAAIQVDPHHAEAIAEGMKKLVGDSDLRNSLREKGLCRAKQFDWSLTAAKAERTLRYALGLN